MQSLRETLQKVEPAGATNSVRELADLMNNSGNPYPDIQLNQLLQAVSFQKRIVLTPLTFLWQNTALFPPSIDLKVKNINLYKGAEPEKVIPALVQRLQNEQPDIVGLCEVWIDTEAQEIKNALSDIYPYTLYGPWEDAPRPLEFEYFSGGLLLLSRHPIVASHQTIYRQCCGEDCFSNKGILHARIAVTGHPVQYDVFITHTQSCPPEEPWLPGAGSGSCEDRLEIDQVRHLNSFIQAHSSPEGVSLLMGDLNIKGQDPNTFNALHERLKKPLDLWQFAGNGSAGITNDSHGSFQADRAGSFPDNPQRNKEGSRIDYMFSGHQNRRFFPLYKNTKVINDWQTSPGRDLSDHYGLQTHLKCIREILVEPQTIQNIKLSMTAFHCLRETGVEGAGDDEMQFRMWGESGKDTEQTLRFDDDDVNTGKFSFFKPNSLSFGDPGNVFPIKLQAWEAEPILKDVSLGLETIYIRRIDLLYYKQIGLPIQLASPILRGGGGEYVVFVELKVT